MTKLSAKAQFALNFLSDGVERYGLAIRRASEISDNSAERISSAGLYNLLNFLEERGLLISREEDASLHHQAIPRRLYQITKLGKAAVKI